ncbi:bacteriohemerythrin [Desulfovibrio sp. ZJ369]|uniref:bacteriohemerythrin n=1 Tax=Desulfovibrio sp. ZJ369 TaxID=2709793 RepID=UPI0013EB9988|nr:bacteriohemerythrin [Desulfovibrio sp. ZJ369]
MGILLQIVIIALLGVLAALQPEGVWAWMITAAAAVCAGADAWLWLRAGQKRADLLSFAQTLLGSDAPSSSGEPAQRLRHCLEALQNERRKAQEQAAAAAERLRTEAQALRAESLAASDRERTLADKISQSAPVLEKAHNVCNRLSTEVRRLSELVGDVEKGVEVQRDRLGETSAVMERVAEAARVSSDRVRGVTDNAEASRGKAVTGEKEVHEAVSSIEEVKSTVMHLKEAMAGLGEKASNIGQVMSVINEVADQTNLLALNAAIEAARAGDAGRGFAVVADEVRKLAEKTMGATREVEEAVLAIQEETRVNVQTVEKAALLIVEGAQRASSAGSFMVDIVRDMEGTAEHLKIIAQGAAEQSESNARTNGALEEIRDVAERTASNMETFTAALLSFKTGMEDLDMIVNALVTGDYAQASSDKFVQWTSKLDLHVPVIDRQHRMLCGYINELYTAMRNNRTGEELRAIVKKLRDYTASHFSEEEKLFAPSAYPGTAEHKEIHRKFVARLDEFEEQLKNGTATVSMDLLSFLKDWLINHIAGTDPGYVPYLPETAR